MNINQWLKNHPRACSRGAPMGAADWRGDPDYGYKFHLQKLKVVDGDYTLDGTYWGTPTDRYCAMSMEEDEPEVRMFIRAPSRDKAKDKVLDAYPNAKFYR